jgi:DNA-binding MarR family transcriptional regulator
LNVVTVEFVIVAFVTIKRYFGMMSNDASQFDLTRFLPYCLNRAAEEVSLGFRDIYGKTFGITRSEWRVLAHLGQFGSMTAREIADRSRIHKTKISRAVFSLETKRWLTRRPDPRDRRMEHLELTAEGRRNFRKIGQAAAEYDQQVRQMLNPEEEAVLMKALARLSGREAG